MAKHGQAGRARKRGPVPRLEELEGRTLLSAVPVLVQSSFIEGHRGSLTLDVPALTQPTPVTVSWGDGTAAKTVLAGPWHEQLTLHHRYAEDGSYQYTVTVGQAAQPQLRGSLQVRDAPLVAVKGVDSPPDLQVGRTWSGPVASFVDTNRHAGAADFSATINWGDGRSSPATRIVADAHRPGRFLVYGQHVYTQVGQGPYTVSVAIQDKGGSTGTAVSHFTVASAPMPLAGMLKGTYLRSWMVPDVGATLRLTGSGTLAQVGLVSATGSLLTPGLVLNGHATGSLVLTTSTHDTITLQLTGPTGPGLAYAFSYTVTAATGADANLLHETGTVAVRLTPFAVDLDPPKGVKPDIMLMGGAFSLTITPTVA